MVFLRIYDKNEKVKFDTEGYCINIQYQGLLNEGDKIALWMDGSNTIALKLDSTLKESFLYLPNRSFTYS